MIYTDNQVEQFEHQNEAEDLSDDIIRAYKKFNADLKIPCAQYYSGRFIMEVKLKGNTRESHLRANAPDVQLKLRLPIFYVLKHNYRLYLVASRKKIVYEHLPMLLHQKAYSQVKKQMLLPYLVGYTVLGGLCIIDLSKQMHLLLGGSSNSGKTVGLQVAISSISYSSSPEAVNFILIDLGANDLFPFETLPHLACPIIQSRDAALQALTALVDEMKRRKILELSNKKEFDALPRLVLVIDEFPALFQGVEDKHTSASLRELISSLLQRGRHNKIHLILAAQNPTSQIMKVDLGNITARIAFKCARKNYSETILGESGAERLTAQGDLLMKASNYDGLQQIHGAYLTPDELGQLVQTIADKWQGKCANQLAITNSNIYSASDHGPSTDYGKITAQPSVADRKLAAAVVWALGEDTISVNQIQRKYQLGWNKAAEMVKRLEAMGIVEQPVSKLPRYVVPVTFGNIPVAMLEFLHRNGITDDDVKRAISAREGKPGESAVEQPQRILDENPPTAAQNLQPCNNIPKKWMALEAMFSDPHKRDSRKRSQCKDSKSQPTPTISSNNDILKRYTPK